MKKKLLKLSENVFWDTDKKYEVSNTMQRPFEYHLISVCFAVWALTTENEKLSWLKMSNQFSFHSKAAFRWTQYEQIWKSQY